MRTSFGLLILSWSLTVGAAETTVPQAGQMFLKPGSEPKAEAIKATPSAGRGDALANLSIKVGDELVFKNLDKVTHNVYGEGFDLQAQTPGAISRQRFTKPGKQTIRCAIHPKMKFELEVQP